jgi:hypothetical protein
MEGKTNIENLEKTKFEIFQIFDFVLPFIYFRLQVLAGTWEINSE